MMSEGKEYVVAVIPAKGDSTRLENKNRALLQGNPLLYHTIWQAKKSQRIRRIYVSTDCDDIARLARKEGVDSIMRSTTLSGETPLTKVYQHALESLDDERITHLIGLQPDHPDRNVNLDEVIAYALEKDLDDLISVDARGHKNGSVRILKAAALRNQRISFYSGSVMDDATNIHTLKDLTLAEIRLRRKERPLEIRIKNKIISNHSPVFVVAEGACNHLCDLSLAKRMIDEAESSGADAIKFQTYKAERLVAKDAQSYWNYGSKISQYQYYKNLDKFDHEEYRILFDYAKEREIIVFSTPFDIQSADMLHDLEMPLFKIASCSMTDLKLIRHTARFQKPMILSTGGSELAEIQEAVETIYAEHNFDLIILACTLSYPAKQEDAHLSRIGTLRETFPEAIIGLSDHTEPDEHMVIPAIGVSLGARVIEKHYTLDRTMSGSGHAFSVDPSSLRKMIENIRVAEKALGTPELTVREIERKARESARFSIVASRDIRKGETLEPNTLVLKRPGTGILPKFMDDVVGRKILRDIKCDEPLRWEDVR